MDVHPTLNPADSPDETPEAGAEHPIETQAAARQANPVVIGIVAFVLGFVTALAFTQVINMTAESAYKTALNDAVQAFARVVTQPQQEAAPEQAAGQPANAEQRYEVSADDDPYLGPEDAPVTIIEFSDFRCPYCRRFAETTLHPLLEQYGDQVRFVYRDFPILGDLSFQAALAAECANEQGEFWAYHDLLFENQQTLSQERFTELAEEAGMDGDQFAACLDEETYRDEVVADFQAARALGATGTPAFFINGRFVSGAQPLLVFQEIIDSELATE
ncbi:MAG: hypothetical protein Kow0077_32950 [Anaerolineae bacterium]